jgi:hypothetical protein
MRLIFENWPSSKLYTEFQFKPHRDPSTSVINTILLLLFREIIVIYCENDAKRLKTFCDQNADFFMLRHVVNVVTTGL